MFNIEQQLSDGYRQKIRQNAGARYVLRRVGTSDVGGGHGGGAVPFRPRSHAIGTGFDDFSLTYNSDRNRRVPKNYYKNIVIEYDYTFSKIFQTREG